MAASKYQSTRTFDQMFEEIVRKVRQRSSTDDPATRERLNKELGALEQEYRELTGERIVY